MTPFVPKRKPSFFWQGILISLPVIILAAVGFFSLRQDKALARHEAEQRAQELADELLPKCWSALTNRASQAGHHTFAIDSEGQLLIPPSCPITPIPLPLVLQKLSPAQTELWVKAQQAECKEKDPQLTIEAYRHFLDSNPPTRSAGAAHYALGLQLTKLRQFSQAYEEFDQVIAKYPNSVGETGIPLRPLAEVKLLELFRTRPGFVAEERSTSLELVCSNAVARPTPLSSEILSRLSTETRSTEDKTLVQQWMNAWTEDEESRELFAAAHDVLASSTNRLFWFSAPEAWGRTLANSTGPSRSRPRSARPAAIEEQDWLAIGLDQTVTNRSFMCLAESEVGALLAELVSQERHIPDYFSIGVEVAGRKLARFAPDPRVWHDAEYIDRNSGGEKAEYTRDPATTVLATAQTQGADPNQLKLSVYLSSPATLFRNQRARTFWFGALIAAAAMAASIGLVAAYRAYGRQLRLSEMKSNFVSSVSHELRAPIASVRLMAESLERGRISEGSKQREYFRFIVQECRRLSSLIENVLDFSRIEQGRKQYEFEPTDLVALARTTIKLLEPYAAERHIQLQLQLPNGLNETSALQAMADGKALQQAVINLLDNAIKHSPAGQTVVIGLAASESNCGLLQPQAPTVQYPASSIQLWVEDHGEGIPASEHEKIFERFYRCGAELRRQTQGVGIGLSIVKHIVEAHGGRVTVRSDVGQGSRFTIELPATTQDQAFLPWNAY